MVDRHRAIKDCPWVQDTISTRRKLPQKPFTPLISKSQGEGIFVSWGARTLAMAGSKKKTLKFSDQMCTRCGWRQGSGLMRKAHVCLGKTDRAAYLHRSLSMSGSCAHCPSGCHPFEERETLKGTKGSSKGKFLLQAGQRSLQSKKSLWFCIWHMYAPFLLRTSLEDFWLDLNFQKEKYPESTSVYKTQEKDKKSHATPQDRKRV